MKKLKRQNTIKVAVMAGAAALMTLTPRSPAQSADALIDKLVDKGILTVKEAQALRDDADKNFTQALSVKNGTPDWVSSLKFSGDMRGRFEGFYGENPLFTDRNRFRYRIRFGVAATLADDLEAGFRIGSGEQTGGSGGNAGAMGGDPISNNTTMQDNGSKKFIYLDQAYGKWTPFKGPSLTGGFTVGKMENPFVFSDLVFDQDYTPEGAAMQFAYRFDDRHSLKFNGGGFIVDELSASAQDPYYVGAQVRWDAAWNARFSTTLGAAYLNVLNSGSITNSSVPNINRGNDHLADGTLAHKYHPFEADASATLLLDSFPLYTGAFPIKFAGDCIYNPGAPGNTDNYGYSVGVTFGKSGKKGTWDLSYNYKWLGANAWWEELVDSDFGAFYAATNSPANSGAGIGYGSGTNVKGHIVRFAYSPFDALTLSVKCFLTSLITPYPGGSESGMNRVQVDAVWKF
jgi:hypothetical protein